MDGLRRVPQPITRDLTSDFRTRRRAALKHWATWDRGMLIATWPESPSPCPGLPIAPMRRPKHCVTNGKPVLALTNGDGGALARITGEKTLAGRQGSRALPDRHDEIYRHAPRPHHAARGRRPRRRRGLGARLETLPRVLAEVEPFARELAQRYVGRPPSGVRILSAGPNLASAEYGMAKFIKLLPVPVWADEIEEFAHRQFWTCPATDLVIYLATNPAVARCASASAAALSSMGMTTVAIDTPGCPVPGATLRFTLPEVPERLSPLFAAIPAAIHRLLSGAGVRRESRPKSGCRRSGAFSRRATARAPRRIGGRVALSSLRTQSPLRPRARSFRRVCGTRDWAQSRGVFKRERLLDSTAAHDQGRGRRGATRRLDGFVADQAAGGIGAAERIARSGRIDNLGRHDRHGPNLAAAREQHRLIAALERDFGKPGSMQTEHYRGRVCRSRAES